MSIEPIVMPKWGLAMEEGTLAKWAVAPGQAVGKGQEIADIETTKIANAFESPANGTIRRLVAPEGQTLSVGALLAVVADPSVPDSEVDAFIEKFQSEFTPVEKSVGGGPQTRIIACRRAFRADAQRRRRRRHAGAARARLRLGLDVVAVHAGAAGAGARRARLRSAGPWRHHEGDRRGRRDRPRRRHARGDGRAGPRQGSSRRPFAGRRDFGASGG